MCPDMHEPKATCILGITSFSGKSLLGKKCRLFPEIALNQNLCLQNEHTEVHCKYTWSVKPPERHMGVFVLIKVQTVIPCQIEHLNYCVIIFLG